MTRYFAQNTPRAGLEHIMMSVPGFQKRGGGMMILSRFCYKPEDVDCRYCLHYRRRSCQVRTCPYIAERLKSGAIEYLDLILEYFGHIPHAGLHKRIQAVEHWSGPDQAVLHTVSVHLRSRFADRVWDDAPPGYLAALYLLASKERLWQPALPALSHDSIDFSRIVSKPHGFAIQDYPIFYSARRLYDLKSPMEAEDLAHPKLVSDLDFHNIIYATMIARYGKAVMDASKEAPEWAYVLKAVLSSAQHPEYGQITVPFPIPDEKYDRMIELLEPLEIGDALRQDCRVDELDSFYTVLNRLVGSLVNFDELDYLAKRLDSFDDGEAAQFQGMACKLGVSNIKDFINLTFCCQQATVITDFSDLDAIGRQHYMTMQGGGCRIEELERLDGRKFALDLILNHLEGRITPYGVVYDNGMKLEQLYDGRHFPCYHYQPNLLAVGLSSRQEPENTDQITWLLLPCSEQQLQRGIARSGVNIHDARIWYEDSLLPSEVEEVLEGQREDLFALNDMATAIAALSDLEQKKLTAVMEMAKPECAGEIRELAKNLELFEFAPKVRTPAEYGRYMIQDSGHYEYDPNLEEFYDYERYGKLRMEKETGAFTEKGYVAYCGTLTLGELMAGGPAEQHQREQEFQMGGM